MSVISTWKPNAIHSINLYVIGDKKGYGPKYYVWVILEYKLFSLGSYYLVVLNHKILSYT